MMSVMVVIIYAMVTTAAVLYSGGTALETIFEIDKTTAVLVIAAFGLATCSGADCLPRSGPTCSRARRC